MNKAGQPRILFLQATEAAAYPPLIHASRLMADAGWRVTVLTAPIAGRALTIAPHPGVEIFAVAPRASFVMGKLDYAGYCRKAGELALRLRPDVVYASDPLGCAPGLIAAGLASARLVYHEHDSPAPGGLGSLLRRFRRKAVERAELVILPNAERAFTVGEELGCSDKTITVWNLPCLAELPRLQPAPDEPLQLYYHGGINPDLVPIGIVEALNRLQGRVKLRLVGYQSGAAGYVETLRAGPWTGGSPLVEYIGEIPRDQLLACAAQAHVGLALVPASSANFNMSHMVGASNKAFDYMAAGQAVLVSDLPGWTSTFVEPGFARSCDPGDPASLAAAAEWFAENAARRRDMGLRGRAKIESAWNYDTAFAPVLSALADARAQRV